VIVSTDGVNSTLTPGEILERLKARIKDLEAALAEAQRTSQVSRRLQDMSPDELALEAVGAAGDIIKAARQQAADLRQAALADASKARDAAHQSLSQARAETDQLRRDAESARNAMMNEARENSDRILARVRQEAAEITAKAITEAEDIRGSAQAESDSLIAEAQKHLQASMGVAEQSTASAKEEGRRIVEAARTMADSLREESRAEARTVIGEALSQMRIQEQAMTDLLNQVATLRTSVGSVLDAIRSSADSMAAESARAEATARSYLAAVTQLKADLQARIGPVQKPD
jgi:cell division septum initiation protein DivIVA